MSIEHTASDDHAPYNEQPGAPAMVNSNPSDGADEVLPAKVSRKLTKSRFNVPGALRTPLSVIGLVIITLWVLVIIFAPLLEPHDPFDQSGPRLAGPSDGYWFGTDTLGRDIFSRVIAASRISIPSSISEVASMSCSCASPIWCSLSRQPSWPWSSRRLWDPASRTRS